MENNINRDRFTNQVHVMIWGEGLLVLKSILAMKDCRDAMLRRGREYTGSTGHNDMIFC